MNSQTRSEGLFEAKIDAPRNHARTRFSGHLTASVMQAAATEVEKLLPDLKPGFSLLGDFSAVSAMDLESAPHLTHIMDLCRDRGLALVVRILPPPHNDIGINILSLLHYRGTVKTITVDTLDEAERALK